MAGSRKAVHTLIKLVWAIADSKRQGYLGFKEFIVAMQLLSLAQVEHDLNSILLKSASDVELLEPPEMEGLDSILLCQKRSGSTNNGVSEINVAGHPRKLETYCHGF